MLRSFDSIRSRFFLSFVMTLAVAACAPSTGDRSGGTEPPAGGESRESDCINGIDDDGDDLIDCLDPGCSVHSFCAGIDASMPALPDAMSVPGDACASVDIAAEEGLAPVDIIWVVDSSGSMRGEAEIVQSNMNTFSATIGASGIDYRVVVISSSSFVRVPPPLGEDAERFRFIDQEVGSSAALSQMIDQFDAYSDFLREGAITHFIAVTDDESGLDAMSFRTRLEALLGHSFQLHAIASPPGSRSCMTLPIIGMVCDDGCSGPGGDAADNGDIYWEAAASTGGLTFSICTEDWSGLFSTLSAAIAMPTPLPCVYALPVPPDGSELDPARVNVVFSSSSGAEETLPNVGEYGRCGASGGWYYDESSAPTQIYLCPASCDRVSSDLSGSVNIAFGCATVVI